MNANIFLDTNIIVYSYSNNEPEKQKIARDLISNSETFISTQVLQELTNTITKKLGLNYATAAATINECIQNNQNHINTPKTLITACEVADRYGFSFYDSLIIAAALECNCNVLYTEDMQHNQVINNSLKIVNPFK